MSRNIDSLINFIKKSTHAYLYMSINISPLKNYKNSRHAYLYELKYRSA
jgi:hypothetical protein